MLSNDWTFAMKLRSLSCFSCSLWRALPCRWGDLASDSSSCLRALRGVADLTAGSGYLLEPRSEVGCCAETENTADGLSALKVCFDSRTAAMFMPS